MENVTVSDKFQVLIPKDVRETMDLSPRQELAVWLEGDIIHMTPMKKIKNPTKVLSSLTKKKFNINIEQLEKEIEEDYE